MTKRAWLPLLALLGYALLAASTGLVAFTVEGSGTPPATAHRSGQDGTGHDAEWLGHAWVDGRKGQSDVDALARQLRTTGIRDLFIHSGPLSGDGSLDSRLLPRARWLTGALHAALPAVRVQAWLGGHPVPEHLHLDSSTTRSAILGSVRQLLDDGYDGVHYDLEPVVAGDRNFLALLDATHALTRQRHALLSVSAIHTAPVPWLASVINALPGRIVAWNGGYLHQVALRVDQVALMAYDTGLPTQASYAGYVRRATEEALARVPSNVDLLIGVPAYHDHRATHHESAETVAAALRGVRLALGSRPPRPGFGVAMYVDFAATDADWAAYHGDW